MPSKSTLTRWFFIIVSVFIIGLVIWNTTLFFNQLKENERKKMEIWASAFEELRESELNDSNNEIGFLLNIISKNETTPMVLYTYKEDIYNLRNIQHVDTSETEKIKKLIARYETEYKPIDITYQDEVLSTVYYGNSPIINKIKYYPAALILIIILLFVAIYFFYQTAKSSEQNKLWAGMAKETAHQIGTPLSSLVGWTEILKDENVNPSYITEIEKDVSRLKTITERFSKVGSVPKLEAIDIVEETRRAFDYLKSRSSKLIEFELKVPNASIPVQLNSQLYGWTIENLVKNGIDAMKGQGKITIEIVKQDGKYAIVRITDTGKGIPKRNQKKVFKPGFTTKKRGWGLGLSLAKRIIEEYHRGKIYVAKSTKDQGTTFEMALAYAR
ncbi:MAG: HAMP domain-containing histidine kinase [Flavobacteriaceae bacterium]|nr:HAMP domain-containing histidine kinase [Flavobacteriaceae bacterium]